MSKKPATQEMTLDKLIADLVALRQEHDGDTMVKVFESESDSYEDVKIDIEDEVIMSKITGSKLNSCKIIVFSGI